MDDPELTSELITTKSQQGRQGSTTLTPAGKCVVYGSSGIIALLMARLAIKRKKRKM